MEPAAEAPEAPARPPAPIPRTFGEYVFTNPSRFIEEIPAALIEEIPSTFVTAHPSAAQYREPRGRGGYRGQVRETSPTYAYEDEDQSVPSGLEVA